MRNALKHGLYSVGAVRSTESPVIILSTVSLRESLWHKAETQKNVNAEVLLWPQSLPLLVTNDDTIYSPLMKQFMFAFLTSATRISDTHPAFHNTLVGFAGDVNLVHSSPQVFEEESPVAGTQVHLAGLPGFRGALLCPLVQQASECTFVFHAHILWGQDQYNQNERNTKTSYIGFENSQVDQYLYSDQWIKKMLLSKTSITFLYCIIIPSHNPLPGPKCKV